MTTLTARPDPRPTWLRVTVWTGTLLVALAGVQLTVVGVLAIGEPRAGFLLCFGLGLLVAAVGGVAREVAEARITRRAPEPRLASLPDGEPALLLPRDPAPTRISSLVLLGFAGVLALGAGFAASEQRWVLMAVLVLLAAYAGYVSAPHRIDAMTGGMWFTPTRVVQEYRGVRWTVPWEDVTGAVPQQPMPVMVRADRVPDLERTGPRGRGWNPHHGEGVLAVDTGHLAGGSTLAGYVITKSLADPAMRRVLGTPESLPRSVRG